MSAKELNLERQNRIIQVRQLMERGEISFPDYHEELRKLGLNPNDPEDEALQLYGYRKPDWCTCVFARNMELRPCIKCGALTPFIYESVSGFQTKGPLCPTCHDEIDDCSPEHGETDERTPWPKQAGGVVSKKTFRDLRWLE